MEDSWAPPQGRWARSIATKGVDTVRARPAGRMVGSIALALSMAAAGTAAALGDDTAPVSPATDLTLVTLQGPGTSAGTREADDLLARQDAVLAAIGAAEPV